MSEKFDVNSTDEFAKVMKDRLKTARKRQMNEHCMSEDTPSFNHLMVANTMIKALNSLKVDKTVVKIISMRILAPLQTGKERTHMSIAIELGMREWQVKEAEVAGVQILEDCMMKFSEKEFIDKYNTDKIVSEEINKLKNG